VAKTYKNIYQQVYSFDALHAAYLRARKGKRYRGEVLRFSARLEENLIQLQNELIWKAYKTGEYREFFVHEPKLRAVAALPFRDRVVQHALVAAIEPIWESRFIFDSYACRVGKGTHAGADRAQALLRKVQRQHGKVYVLKADIHHYFASIDHGVLKSLLRKRVACRNTLWLLDDIIDSTPSPGIPIGNLTSQLFANIYLHELDQFVKQGLHEQHYMRYMDDFIIVHHSKGHLQQARVAVEQFLGDELRLSTNSKTQVFPVALHRGRALDFLGYKIWPTHRLLRKDSVRRMRRKVLQYRKGRLERDKLLISAKSWLGHAGHANTFRMVRRLFLD
jgi:retron-type reverse transcriptase